MVDAETTSSQEIPMAPALDRSVCNSFEVNLPSSQRDKIEYLKLHSIDIYIEYILSAKNSDVSL